MNLSFFPRPEKFPRNLLTQPFKTTTAVQVAAADSTNLSYQTPDSTLGHTGPDV